MSDLWSATVQDWPRFGRRYSLKLELAVKGLALLLVALLLAPQAHAREPLEGLYEDNKGAVAIARFGEFGDGLFYIDYAGGRIGALIQTGERIAVGEGLADSKSDAGEIVRMKTGLRAEVDGETRALRTLKLVREDFDVVSGDVKLVGELVHRADAPPKGTVVIVHGSNDAPRRSYEPWTMFLASRGWTVAVFDKRGSGASTGDWTTGSFTELAADIRAVAGFARARLPKKPLGLFGISQAGWVMPLAARDGGIDFIVSLMGPAAAPGEQTMETVIGQLDGYGFGKADIAKALAYYRLDLDVTMGKRPWDEIDAAYKKASAEKAEWLVAPPEAKDSPTRAFLGRIARFDVGPYWAKVHVPVLAMFGTRDSIVPVNPNAALLRKMLKPNREASVVVIAGANHVGMIAKTGTFAEYPTLDRFAPAYFGTLGDWLDKRAH